MYLTEFALGDLLSVPELFCSQSSDLFKEFLVAGGLETFDAFWDSRLSRIFSVLASLEVLLDSTLGNADLLFGVFVDISLWPFDAESLKLLLWGAGEFTLSGRVTNTAGSTAGFAVVFSEVASEFGLLRDIVHVGILRDLWLGRVLGDVLIGVISPDLILGELL